MNQANKEHAEVAEKLATGVDASRKAEQLGLLDYMVAAAFRNRYMESERVDEDAPPVPLCTTVVHPTYNSWGMRLCVGGLFLSFSNMLHVNPETGRVQFVPKEYLDWVESDETEEAEDTEEEDSVEEADEDGQEDDEEDSVEEADEDGQEDDEDAEDEDVQGTHFARVRIPWMHDFKLHVLIGPRNYVPPSEFKTRCKRFLKGLQPDLKRMCLRGEIDVFVLEPTERGFGPQEDCQELWSMSFPRMVRDMKNGTLSSSISNLTARERSRPIHGFTGVKKSREGETKLIGCFIGKLEPEGSRFPSRIVFMDLGTFHMLVAAYVSVFQDGTMERFFKRCGCIVPSSAFYVEDQAEAAALQKRAKAEKLRKEKEAAAARRQARAERNEKKRKAREEAKKAQEAAAAETEEESEETNPSIPPPSENTSDIAESTEIQDMSQDESEEEVDEVDSESKDAEDESQEEIPEMQVVDEETPSSTMPAPELGEGKPSQGPRVSIVESPAASEEENDSLFTDEELEEQSEEPEDQQSEGETSDEEEQEDDEAETAVPPEAEVADDDAIKAIANKLSPAELEALRASMLANAIQPSEPPTSEEEPGDEE